MSVPWTSARGAPAARASAMGPIPVARSTATGRARRRRRRRACSTMNSLDWRGTNAPGLTRRRRPPNSVPPRMWAIGSPPARRRISVRYRRTRRPSASSSWSSASAPTPRHRATRTLASSRSRPGGQWSMAGDRRSRRSPSAISSRAVVATGELYPAPAYPWLRGEPIDPLCPRASRGQGRDDDVRPGPGASPGRRGRAPVQGRAADPRDRGDREQARPVGHGGCGGPQRPQRGARGRGPPPARRRHRGGDPGRGVPAGAGAGDPRRGQRAGRSEDRPVPLDRSYCRVMRVNRPGEPSFAGVGTFDKLPLVLDPAELEGVDVAIVGAPIDETTVGRPGTRFGPRAIRLADPAGAGDERPHMDLGVDPYEALTVVDHGDVEVVPGDPARSHEAIRAAVGGVLRAGAFPVVLGGDHSILHPNAGAAADHLGEIGVIHFDAHADDAESLFGVRRSHGTPVRLLVEEGSVQGEHVVQVGLRGYWPGPEEFAWARERGLVWFTQGEIDGIGLDVDLCGMEVVEVSPPYDQADVTALLAHRTILEVLSGLALRRAGRPPSPERPGH